MAAIKPLRLILNKINGVKGVVEVDADGTVISHNLPRLDDAESFGALAAYLFRAKKLLGLGDVVVTAGAGKEVGFIAVGEDDRIIIALVEPQLVGALVEILNPRLEPRCEACGRSLATVILACPKCGFRMPFTARECPRCGTPLRVRRCPFCGALIDARGRRVGLRERLLERPAVGEAVEMK